MKPELMQVRTAKTADLFGFEMKHTENTKNSKGKRLNTKR